MSAPDFTHAHWRKSSRSTGNGGACVEVGTVTNAVGVRDSKLGEQSPIIGLTSPRWETFTRQLKDS